MRNHTTALGELARLIEEAAAPRRVSEDVRSRLSAAARELWFGEEQLWDAWQDGLITTGELAMRTANELFQDFPGVLSVAAWEEVSARLSEHLELGQH